MTMDKIVVISGPTATGKSRLALSLCEQFGGEILSADSRQVYKEADIGTNKMPLPREETTQITKETGLWRVNGVPIHGYDWVRPDEPFTVSHFIERSIPVIAKLCSHKKPVFVVGGTGFYIDTLLGDSPYSNVPPQPALRKQWQTATEEALFHQLQALDSDAASRLKLDDMHNRQRLIRYLELATRAGSVAQATQYSPLKDTVEVLRIGLTADRAVLHHKVQQWTQEALEIGLTDETRLLLERGYAGTKLLQGIIYHPMVQMIQKEISMEEAKKTIEAQLRGYIRRQLVWFRRHPATQWFDVQDPAFAFRVAKLVKLFLTDSKP